MQLDQQHIAVANERKLADGPQMHRFLPRGKWKLRAEPLSDKQLSRSTDVLVTKQKVQITELAKGKVSLREHGQGRPLVRHRNNTVRIQHIEEPNQFAGQEQIPDGILVKIVAKLAEDRLGNNAGAKCVQLPVE